MAKTLQIDKIIYFIFTGKKLNYIKLNYFAELQFVKFSEVTKIALQELIPQRFLQKSSPL